MNRILFLQYKINRKRNHLDKYRSLKEYFRNKLEYHTEELRVRDFTYLSLLKEWITEEIPVCLENIRYYTEKEPEIEEEIRNLNIELTSIILSESLDSNRRF